MMGQRRAQASTMVRQHDYTQRLEQRRVQENKVSGLHAYKADDNRHMGHHQSERSVENKRRAQRTAIQQQEMAAVENIERGIRDREQRALLKEQDEQLAAALYDAKSQRVAEETNARRICEESEELKELKEKLRAAKISKVRATQLEERGLLDRQQLTQDRAMDTMMENDRQAALEREHDDAQRKFFLNMQSRGVLQKQIEERQEKKREAYEAFLREKAMVDEIVAGIEQEDRDKMQAHKDKQQMLQDNIRAYLKERAVWRAEEKRRTEMELQKIQAYNALQGKRHAELKAKKAALKEHEDEVLRKLTKEIEAKKREEEEMRALLDELYQEEAEQKSLERMRMDAENKRQRNAEMFEANENQKAIKRQLADKHAQEEAKWKNDMLEKFAQDKRLEQMNEARRRREMQNYRAEVERMVEERRAMFQAAVDAELEEERQKGEQEAYRLAVVERERKRLLRDHADDLRDYLPKGVLQDTKDYELLYGMPPQKNEDADELAYIRSRNAKSSISLGTMTRSKRNPTMDQSYGSNNNFGGSNYGQQEQRSSRPGSGRPW